MKKITLTFLLIFIAVLGFAQDPEYNYSIEFVGSAGSVETYQIVITSTDVVPSANANEVDNFQVLVGWDAAAFELPAFVAPGNGEFGAAANYIGAIATAAQVNMLPGGGTSDKDIYSVAYPADGNTAAHPSGIFLMRQFTVTRTAAGAGAPNPIIVPVTDPNIVFLNTFNFGLDNSMVVNNGGVLEERFNPSVTPLVLSDDNFNFNDLTFSAYPNPTKGTLYVQNSSPYDFDYEIVNIEGRIVLPEGTLEARKENVLDLSVFNDGIYFMNIKSGAKEKKSIKIILN